MPGKFIGHLGLDYIDGFHWGLQAPLSYDLGHLNSAETVVVPAHFVTDFNSIPRGLWNIFPPTQYGKSSIIHDWLYEGGFIAVIDGVYERHITPTKARVDALYRETLAVEGCPLIKRYAMWFGVRLNIRGGHWGRKSASSKRI